MCIGTVEREEEKDGGREREGGKMGRVRGGRGRGNIRMNELQCQFLRYSMEWQNLLPFHINPRLQFAS